MSHGFPQALIAAVGCCGVDTIHDVARLSVAQRRNMQYWTACNIPIIAFMLVCLGSAARSSALSTRPSPIRRGGRASARLCFIGSNIVVLIPPENHT
eukprot:scaffold3723_cov112-Isochrysis_galbana.AAC.5